MPLTEADVTSYLLTLPEDDLCYEGPSPFCGNLAAKNRAMAESNTVSEYIAAMHAYMASPEGVAFLEARSAARLRTKS